MEAFITALLIGLIPSGYDTFSDFASAPDDHTNTIDLINGASTYRYTIFPNGTKSDIYTKMKNQR